MRLICPNCGAQYEVADDVIPEMGRDVQCSNCGHTWFEKPGASALAEEDHPMPAPAAEAAPMDDGGDPAIAAAPPEPEPEAPPEIAPGSTDEDEPEADEEEEEEPAAEDAAAPPASDAASESIRAMLAGEDTTGFFSQLDAAEQDEAEDEVDLDDDAPRPGPHAARRPALDASVADILREEAEREEAARNAERGGLETQSDLGLPEPPDDYDTAKEDDTRSRIARLKGEEMESEQEQANIAAANAAAAASRRELLPDIEEINSTLRSDAERDEPETEAEQEVRRRGFRFGFFTVLLIIAGFWLLYLFADELAAAVPALETALAAYVAAVDELRLWLDLRVQDLVTSLGGTVEGASEE